LAQLNAEGITTVEIRGRGLSSGSQPYSPGVGGRGLISGGSFEAVAEQFGASQAQAVQAFTAINANGNATVPNVELLSAIANTKNAASLTAQALLSLMDLPPAPRADLLFPRGSLGSTTHLWWIPHLFSRLRRDRLTGSLTVLWSRVRRDESPDGSSRLSERKNIISRRASQSIHYPDNLNVIAA
jgi:hypothetical protein